MLEGVLAALLERIAGKYVDGIDRKAAKLSVWSGHVVLNNLSLKKSALDDLDLPFKLKYGRLDEMSLEIPWKNLRSQPLVVTLSGLYVIMAPNVSSKTAPEDLQAKLLQSKRAMVAELDAQDLAGAGTAAEDLPSSFTSRLITKIVDNIQLKVSNIHIRYEDEYADADHPFAFGVMLQSFSAQSTDMDWRPCFVEEQKILHKSASLQGLSFYLNSDLPSNAGYNAEGGDSLSEAVSPTSPSSASPVEARSRIIVSIAAAEITMSKDRSVPTELFVELCMDKTVHRTKVVEKTNHPEWDEEFEFCLSNDSPSLSVSLYNQEQGMLFGRSKVCVGSTTIQINELVKDSGDAQWFDLHDPRKPGEETPVKIQIKISQQRPPVDSQTDSPVSLLGPTFASDMIRMVQLHDADGAAGEASPSPAFQDPGSPVSNTGPSFVVKPIDASLRLKINKSDIPNMAIPKYDAALEMVRVSIRVSRRQYRDLLRTLDFLGNHERIIRYAQFRPHLPFTEAPRAWWSFAIQCVVWERAQRSKRFDKRAVIMVIAKWPRYAALYRRRFAEILQVPPLDALEITAMKALEDELPFEAIAAARESIHRQLRKHAHAEKLRAEQQKLLLQQPAYSALFSSVKGWFGFGARSRQAHGKLVDTDELRSSLKELITEFGIEEGADSQGAAAAVPGAQSVSAVDLSRYTRVRLEFLLRYGSCTVTNNLDTSGVEFPLVMLKYRGLRMEVILRPYSSDVELQLGEFVMSDLFSKDLSPGFNCIVSRFNTGTAKEHSMHASTTLANTIGKAAIGVNWGIMRYLTPELGGISMQGLYSVVAKEDEARPPLLWLKYQSRPPDEQVDSRLIFRLDRMTLVYNTSVIRALNDFLDVGTSPTLELIARAGKEQLEETKKRSQQNLKSALTNKLVIDMCIDLQSPIILIPQEVRMSDEKVSVMIFQPGNLSVWSMSSHLSSTSPLLQSMVNADTTDERYYNTLLLELKDVSVALCDRAECWSVAGQPEKGSKGLIQDIRVSICVQNSIAPTNCDLTRTKVKVALPVLNLNFSRRKYAMLLDVLASISDSPSNDTRQSDVPDEREIVSGVDVPDASVRNKPQSMDQPHIVEPTLADWKLLDVLVKVAPAESEVRLHISDEDMQSPQPVADLSIQEISGTYVSYGGGSTKLNVSVGTVIILDSRPNTENKYRRLLAPKVDPATGTNPDNAVLSFSIQTDVMGHSDYILRLEQLNVFLIPTAILPIWNVFQASSSQPTQLDESVLKAGVVSGTRVLSPQATSATAVVTYHVFFIGPSVTTIEDESDPQSRCIKIETSLMLKHSQYSDNSFIGSMHLQDLLLEVKENSRIQGRNLFSEAISLSMDYSDFDGNGTRASLLSSEAEIRLNFQDIKLLTTTWNHVLGDFSLESSAGESKSQEPVQEVKPKRDPEQGSKGADLPKRDPEQGSKGADLVKCDYTLNLVRLRVFIFNDCTGYNEPFCDILLHSLSAVYLQSDANTSGWGIQARSQLSLYNYEVMEFEPIVEDWGFSAEYTKKEKMLSSGDDSSKSLPGSDPVASNDAIVGCPVVETYSLVSNELLNVNVMEVHILNSLKTLTAWQAELFGTVPAGPQENIAGEHAYRVRNRCGIQLNIRDFWGNGQGSVVVVAPSATEPIFFYDKSQRLDNGRDLFDRVRQSRLEKGRMLHVSVGPSAGPTLEHHTGLIVPLDSDGARTHSLAERGELIAVVSSEETSCQRIVTIQSRYSLDNLTHEDYQVQFTVTSDQRFSESVSVCSKSVCDLPPAALCNRYPQDVAIAVRPVVEGLLKGPQSGWSQSVAVRSGLDVVVNTCSPSSTVAIDDQDGISAVEEDTYYIRIVARTSTVKLSSGDDFELFTIVLMPVFVISNLLPCSMRFSFWIEGMEEPLAAFDAKSGEDVPIHTISLTRRVNFGVAVAGLDEGSEFVPIFSPDGSALESYINLYDSARDYVRLQLFHEQEAQQIFSLRVCAPYWLVNRTGFPVVIAQKWTASSVTIIGGQQKDPDFPDVGGNIGPTMSEMDEILTGSCHETIPKIFSFGSKVDLGGSKACIRLDKPYMRFSSREGRQVACEWSRPFYIEAVGSSGELELVGEEFVVEITFHVSAAEGKFSKTKIVTLLPRYVVCNVLQRPVLVGQVGCEDVSPAILQHRGMHVVRWLHESKDRRLKIRFAANAGLDPPGLEWHWSEAVPVCHIGYSPLKLRSNQALVFNTMVQSSLQGSVTVIVLREYDLENPALKIVNRSAWATIYYRQACVDRCLEEKADPGQEVGFCWDSPHCASHALIVRLRCGNSVHTIECDMDRLGVFPDLSVDGKTLRIAVEAQGPTKVLLVVDVRMENDWEVVSSPKGSTTKATMVSAAGASPALQISVQLAGVGVSVIDHTPQELLYATVFGIAYRTVTVDAAWHMLEFRLRRVQIDNQTSNGNPVLLCAASAAVTDNRPRPEGSAAPPPAAGGPPDMLDALDSVADRRPAAAAITEDLLVLRINQSLTSPGVDSYELVDASVGDLSIDVEECLLVSLIAAFKSLASPTVASAPAMDCESDVGTIGALNLAPLMAARSTAGQRWVYIESLRISPMRIYVTFHGSEDAHGLLQSKAFSRLPVFAFVEAVKAMVSNIDRAPIILAPIDWERPFLPREELIGRVGRHYTHCVLRGFYRLVGSLEFLGNPTGLVSNIGAGLSGAVEASREGIKEGRLGRGLARGAGTLAAGTVQGVFGSAAGLSGAMGKGLAQLTFDGSYKRARALLDHNRPAHAGQGVWQGSCSLGKGIVQGVTGVVTMPVRGYTKEGARGAVKGLGKGLVGAVVKPVAGLADLVAQTSEGIRNTPEYMGRPGAAAAATGVVARVRLPRRWEGGRAVTRFDGGSALGAAMLAQLAREHGWPEDEAPLDHVGWREPVGGGAGGDPAGGAGASMVFWIILTLTRLILCQQGSGASNGGSFGGGGLRTLRLISAVRLDSILQVREVADGVYIIGLDAAAGVLTRCALRCRSLLRLTPAGSGGGSGAEIGFCGGGGGAAASSGRQLGLLGGRVVYGLLLCVRERALRNWVLKRLRHLTDSDSSDLPGEDWSLVPAPSAPAPPGATPSCGGDSGGPEGPARRPGRVQDDEVWRVLSCMSVRVTGAETRRRGQFGEHSIYAILCRPAASAAAADGGGDDDDGWEEGRESWIVYRRFREFVALREELCRVQARALRAAADPLAQRPGGGGGGGGGAAAGSSAWAWRGVVPGLPRRRLLCRVSPDVVRERVWALDAFLSALLDICCGRGAAAGEADAAAAAAAAGGRAGGVGGGHGGRPPAAFARAVARFLMSVPAPEDTARSTDT